MTALDTSLRLLASAGITGTMFALPLGLALSWKVDLGELDVQTTAVPMVALAAMPLAMVPAEGTLGGAASDEPSGDVDAPAADGSGPILARGSQLEGVASRTVGSARKSTPKATPAARPTPRPKKARTCDTPNPGIQRDGASVWTVDRAIVDAYAKRPGTLGALGYVARHDGADGKADGFRVGGIKCGNDLHAAGFRNGDVVHSVNGKSISNIPQALWAYGTLRKADELQVRLSRKGEIKLLTFDLR